MSETALARTGAGPVGLAPIQVDTGSMDLLTLCKALAGSGYFKDARDASQAIVKVLYGQELGVGPVTAMMSIHVIEGKPAPSANLLAAMVKRARPLYDYRIVERTAKRCEIAFFDRGEDVGHIVWTIEEAASAGLAGRATWKSYPRQMLFNRAMSEGVRTFFPDLFGGAPVYTPEELGADVDGETGEPVLKPAPVVNRETGEVIDVSDRVQPVAPAQPAPAPPPPANGGSEQQSGSVTARLRAALTREKLPTGRAFVTDYGARALGRPTRTREESPEGCLEDAEAIIRDLAARQSANGAYDAAFKRFCRAENHPASEELRHECDSGILGRQIETASTLTARELRVLADAYNRQAQDAERAGSDEADAQEAEYEAEESGDELTLTPPVDPFEDEA